MNTTEPKDKIGRGKILTEQNYKSFYDGFPALLRTINEDGIIIDCNETYAKYLGYSKNEIIGSSIFDSVTEESIDTLMDSFEFWKRNGRVKHQEIWLKKKDGTVFPALLSASSLYDAEENLVGSNTIIEDISEIYETRRKLQENEDQIRKQYDELKKTHEHLTIVEQKYRTLYDKSPTLLRTITTEGILADCNEAYADALGYTREEAIGMSFYYHTAERSIDDLKGNLEKWKKSREITHQEIWMKRKDGTIFPALMSGASLYDEQGNLIGRTVALTDLTEIYESKKRLEEKEAKIREQYEELKKLEVAKDEFTSMVSHELKSPLTPIMGFCEALMDPTISGELTLHQRKSLDKILKNASRLKKLISDLLDAQKLDMHKMNFEFKDTDIAELMKHVEINLQNVMKEKQIQFVHTTNVQMSLTTDRDRLEQVFSNLILNAVDFVPKEGGRIEFGAKTDNDEVLFYVKDNGIGIPLEKQKHLFKKFYQADTSMTRRQYGGSGLGLAICKGIVESHGGKIWLESEPNKGTTFYFTIPKAKRFEEQVA
jgi:PAS domain S-box-containing protein